jgi:hypothetical protein
MPLTPRHRSLNPNPLQRKERSLVAHSKWSQTTNVLTQRQPQLPHLQTLLNRNLFQARPTLRPPTNRLLKQHPKILEPFAPNPNARRSIVPPKSHKRLRTFSQ